MKAKLSVLGVRGALPAANRQCMEYGGNTTCISLEYGEEIVCFDAGSGLADLCGSPSGAKRMHILLSHVHIDHILGLYQLSQSDVPQIHLYGEAGEGGSFCRRLETVLGEPYWPLALCKAERIHLHELSGEPQFAPEGQDGIRIATMQGNHPGGSLLYRAEFGGLRVTHALDCETDEETFARLVTFAQGSDLLIWDANFTRNDKQPGWGHSTWEEGLALKRAAGVQRILMTHYCRDYTDAFLREQEMLAGREDGNCVFAREGMVIEL